MGYLESERFANSRRRKPASTTAEWLAAALAGHRCTVTELVEDLVKERIYADKLEQVQTTPTVASTLSVEVGQSLVRRAAVLRGQVSSLSYVYAETLFVPSRLPLSMIDRLGNSTDPIGRIIIDQQLELSKVRLPSESEHPTAIDRFFYSRRYRFELSEVPVMEIAEWFLPDLESVILSHL